MSKGIIYIMTSVVPGLIKIGKTKTDNFEQRMYNLEHDGYRNVTGLKRKFAIEVDNYDDKEILLHTIFEKSRVSDTELFAIDVNVAVQLLSSFDGTVIFPKTEAKDDIFIDAADNSKSKLIPNGTYYFEREKQSEKRTIKASAVIDNGRWTLLKDSFVALKEDAGGGQKAKKMRSTLPLDNNGKLLEDVELGECSPSFAGVVVMNQAVNGWEYWKNDKGQPINIYRKTTD